MDFNPRSPYGERPITGGTIIQMARISIHAPLTGSDGVLAALPTGFDYFNPRSPYGERPKSQQKIADLFKFQSTLPLRGATVTLRPQSLMRRISIHAPLTGSDFRLVVIRIPLLDFNPRSPYGERHILQKFISRRRDFNPRSPYGERPGLSLFFLEVVMISIHAPLTGSDKYFNSHSCPDLISIHAPLTGSDQ